MGTIYIKSNLGITHFAHNYMETSNVASKSKAFKIFSLEQDLNPWPSDYMSNALPSELSGHVNIMSSIIIWTSQCVLDIITFSMRRRPPIINTYYFSAGGCHPSITILLKWHLAITEKDQSTYWNRKGSSEARWWNPECINTYKVSTIFITDYILNYIKEICMGTIYIKSNLGITHFAHNYMETSHVASKPKLLKF